MRIEKIARIHGGQDGAVWGDLLFRFDSRGNAHVYELRAEGSEPTHIADFRLDRAEELAPHSNAVCFGLPLSPTDDFPLLYTNIYNNYANSPDPLRGLLCVYRIFRTASGFSSKLVQLLKIGFDRDADLWCGKEGEVRPYGNFVIDRDAGRLHAFVMCEAASVTRHLSFALPPVTAGESHPTLGVPCCLLTESDVLFRFETPYQRFMQGACIEGGRLYTTEGFTDSKENPAALRIIDLQTHREISYIPLADLGYGEEAECIDFHRGKCLYSDIAGNLYRLEF